MSTVLASNLAGPSSTGTAATLASLNGGPLAGARNRIINGDMRINQRGTAATVNGAYSVDRWWLSINTTGAVSVSQSTVSPTGFTNSLYFDVTTADTSIATTEYAAHNQSIEGLNISDLNYGTANAQTVTLSFWIRSTNTGTYCVSLAGGSNRAYVATYTVSAANTWEYKTITIPGDTSGTWASDNTAGMVVRFAFAAGTSYQTTEGTWATGNFLATSGQVNLLASTANEAYITGVQLEAGTIATPFERRSYGQEFALCQRYYEKQGSTDVIMYPPIDSSGTNARRVWVQYAVDKRAAPTVGLTRSQTLTSIATNSYTNGFRHAGNQGSGLETSITEWNADAEL